MSDLWGCLTAYLVSTYIARITVEGDGFGKFAEIVQAFSLVLLVVYAVVAAFAFLAALVTSR